MHLWNEEDVKRRIDLYEEFPCLWDIADRDNAKRDISEKAIFEFIDELCVDILTIKAKLNSLRARHRRELLK